MARKMTTKKADTTAKTASVKETPAKSVAAAPVENAVKAETEKTGILLLSPPSIA